MELPSWELPSFGVVPTEIPRNLRTTSNLRRGEPTKKNGEVPKAKKWPRPRKKGQTSIYRMTCYFVLFSMMMFVLENVVTVDSYSQKMLILPCPEGFLLLGA